MNNAEYYQKMGMDMIREEQAQRQEFTLQAVATHAERAARIAKMRQQKQDEQRTTIINNDDLTGVTCCAKPSVLYFGSFGEFEYWIADSEGGEL